jgi:hypothetical protein
VSRESEISETKLQMSGFGIHYIDLKKRVRYPFKVFKKGSFVKIHNTNPAAVLPFRRVGGETKVKVFLRTKQDFVMRGFFSK